MTDCTDEKKTSDTLNEALSDAIEICWNSIDDLEERGGIIMFHSKDNKYQFVELYNENHNTSIAPFLFTADRKDYAAKIIPMFKQGWVHYASFHTHPQFAAIPSSEDNGVLFPGFPINYIYSCVGNVLKRFEWLDGNDLSHGYSATTVRI